jgi:ADP-heptose:LPS heptosyltransferase
MGRWRHPIHGLPFDDTVENDLVAEFREQPLGRRVQAVRKALARDAMLVFTGQAHRHVSRVPRGVGRMLWVYTWTTVGDAVMDLAPRRLIPSSIEVDLLIAPALAPLFVGDSRFRAVHTEAAACADDYDFILLDSMRTASLRLKRTRFRRVPFATMRGHHAGERFDRAAYADRRLRQLFGLAAGPVEAPRLEVERDPRLRGDTSHFLIALALGARLKRKIYPHWAEVLEAVCEQWPGGLPGPEFRLLGQGRAAREQQAELLALPPGSRCVSRIDAGALDATARELAACDAFLGVDGGLMHVAIGVGTPGLALFTRVDPVYFLRPESRMVALRTDDELGALPPATVAAAFLVALPGFSASR